MKAGQLRHRLQLQACVETRTTSGAIQKEWSTYQTVSGSINPLKGDKIIQAQQVCPRATHEVQMRGKVPLTTAQRIVFVQRSGETQRERIFNVGHITNLLERNITLVAFVTEVAA